MSLCKKWNLSGRGINHVQYLKQLYLKVMIIWFNVATSTYDLRASMYSIMCTHRRLHIVNENKCPVSSDKYKATDRILRHNNIRHAAKKIWQQQASYQIRQNCGLSVWRECRERVPCHRHQGKPLVSDPNMHHGTWVTHVPWCMSGLLTALAGKTFPAYAQPTILRIW